MVFSPVRPNVLVTASEDGTVKYWKRDAINPPKSINLLTLTTNRPAVSVALHPCAAEICMSASNDKLVRLWDAHEDKEVLSWMLGDNPYNVAWDYNGMLGVATARDKNVYIIDPRSKEFVGKTVCHSGAKPMRATWMGRKPFFLTTGCDNFQTRQVAMWDPRQLEKPLKLAASGSGSGVCTPLYDADTNLFYLSMKGEGAIKVFEATSDDKGFAEITTVASDTPAKGVCLVPKVSLDIAGCEVDQILKVTANAIAPVSMYVIRKNKGFHEDLFPNTAACRSVMTAADWVSGKNGTRAQMSLNKGDAPTVGGTASPQGTTGSAGAHAHAGTHNTPLPKDTSIQIDRHLPQDTQEHVDYGAKHTFVLFNKEQKAVEKKEVRQKANIGPIVRYSKFKNINTEAYMKNTNHDELRINTNCNTLISINRKFFAVPTKGIGGRVLVREFAKTGRVPMEHPCIVVGSEVTAMQWNPFDDHCIATGSEDARVKLWHIPESGLAGNIETPEADLAEHRRKIQTLNWHPTASNVLASSSVDGLLKLWDVEAERSVVDIFGHTDALFNLSFNWTGSQLVTSCKDKYMRVWDPRSADPLVAETVAHDGALGFTASFAGKRDDLIVSAGFSKNSERVTRLWDVRNFDQPISELKLDSQSGVLNIWYDFDNNVYALYGRGDGNMRFYEVSEENGAHKLFFLTEARAGKPVADMAFFPRASTNVKGCELALSARVVGSPPSTIERVSVVVPRTRMEYFQDDIFPPTRTDKPTFTAAEWFAGVKKEVATVDLCPAGMQRLSTAPAIERKAKYSMPTDDERNAGRGITRDDVS